jgi:hypothetical protein
MADGLFYLDSREPHLVSNLGAITMTTTAKAMYTAANFPVLGGQYFNRPGKAIKIEVAFLLTLPASPGNFSFNVHWGTGADANGTLICAAGTPVAATNATKRGKVEVIVRCLTTGTAGTLQATGIAWFDPGVIASTLQPMMIPTSAAAASASLDLTAANIVSIQPLQSGTAGTITVEELKVTALN